MDNFCELYPYQYIPKNDSFHSGKCLLCTAYRSCSYKVRMNEEIRKLSKGLQTVIPDNMIEELKKLGISKDNLNYFKGVVYTMPRILDYDKYQPNDIVICKKYAYQFDGENWCRLDISIPNEDQVSLFD